MRRVQWPAKVIRRGPLLLSLLLPVATAGLPARGQQAGAPAAAAAQPGDAELNAAVALVVAGKHAEAVPALRKFLAEFPQHAGVLPARLRLGEALIATRQATEALRLYQEILDGNPAPAFRAGALLGLGRAHAALEAPEKALPALSEAFRLTEYDERQGPPAAFALGELFLAQRRFAEAAQAFHRVTRWPQDALAPRAYFQVGECYRQAENLLEAAIAYRNMAAAHPRDPLAPKASVLAGGLYLQLGRLDEAEAEFRRVLERTPASPEAPHAQLGLGRVSLARGNPAAARAAFQAAAVLFPGEAVAAEARLRLADTFLAEGNLEEARKRYNSLLEHRDPVLAGEARYSLARVHAAGEQPAAAAAEYEKLMAAPGAGRWSLLARLRLAELRAGAGDTAAALELLRPLADGRLGGETHRAEQDEAALRVGEHLSRREEWAAAERELSALLRRSPAGPHRELAAAHLARLRLAQGDAAGAAERATAVLAGRPGPAARAVALCTLGRVRLASTKKEEQEAGVTALREVLERHEKEPEAPDAAPEAARALLGYYQETRQQERAAEMERLLASRFAGPAAAVAAMLAAAEQDLEAGRLEPAAAAFTAVLDRRPDRSARVRARAGLAEIAAARKRPEEAAEQTRLLAAEAPSPAALAKAHVRIARAHERGGNPVAALAAYRAALAAGPDAETAPGALLAAGRLLEAEGRPAEAAPLYRELVNRYGKAPQVPEALYALAWCQLAESGTAGARPVFLRLVEEHPRHPLAADAQFRLGEAEFAAGRYPAAIPRYRAAAAAARNDALAEKASYRLGWALRLTGDHAAAAEAFQKARARAPQGELAAECRVRAAEELLEQATAEAAEAALAELEPLLPAPRAAENGDAEPAAGKGRPAPEAALAIQARVAAARAHLLLGAPAEALALAGPAARPAHGWYGARAQLLRAEALLRADGGGPRAAVNEFLRVVSLFARYRDLAAEAQYRAGECYATLGNAAAAAAAWQRAAGLYPGTPWAERSRRKLDAPPAGTLRGGD